MFNFLSGTSIDNSRYLLFDVFANSSSYVGFSRSNKFFWGENALISIQHQYDKLYPDNIMEITESPTVTNLFYDLNAASLLSNRYDSYTSESKRKINIVYTPATNNDFDMSNAELANLSDITLNDGYLYLNFMNENWAMIQNLNPEWMFKFPFNDLNADGSMKYKFYIINYKGVIDTTQTPFALIQNKQSTSTITYNKKCKLWFYRGPGQKAVELGNTIEKSVNIIGEVYFNGLDEKIFMSSVSANGLHVTDFLNKNSYFQIMDLNNNAISEDLKYDNTAKMNNAVLETLDMFTIGQDSKFLLLRGVVDNVTKEIQIKVSDYTDIDSLGIWHESYPTETARVVSDANPPALHTTLLRHPLVNNTVFDILGMRKIDNATSLWYAKKIRRDEEVKYVTYGFEIEDYVLTIPTASFHTGIILKQVYPGDKRIYLNDDHTFVSGDRISVFSKSYIVNETISNINSSYIELDKPMAFTLNVDTTISSANKSDIVINDKLAKTKNLSKAKKYGMENVLLDMDIDAIGVYSPTEDIYKQLFLVLNPNITTLSKVLKHNDIFNRYTYSYEYGTLVYLSNKIPILRQTITNDREHFRILL